LTLVEEDAVPEPATEIHRPENPSQGDGLWSAVLPVEDEELIVRTCEDYEKALIEELHTSGRLLLSLDPFLEKVAERLRSALRRELLRVEMRVKEEWWPQLPGYETQRFLSKGGMGRVYQMRRWADGKEVAVKLLLGAELTRVPRLRLIVERLAQIDHRNLVPLYDLTVDNSRTYLVMEFIRGKDLGQERGTLRLSVPNLGESDWANRKKRILNLFQDIADAVDHLHQRGVIHRDLKPENVILDGEGRAAATARSDCSCFDLGFLGQPVNLRPLRQSVALIRLRHQRTAISRAN
jgi:serine/threonine protein kinase